MYREFIRCLNVKPNNTILDVGVTSDRTFDNSNYLEAWHSNPEMIIALGIDDASFLQTVFKGILFVRASGLQMPFEDKSFDYVHCSAVIEHVGRDCNQRQLVLECARVARRGFFITTPNRWFPVEVHTSLPLVHWLPRRWHRSILARLGYEFYCREDNLRLISAADLMQIAIDLKSFTVSIGRIRLWGFTSNLVLMGQRMI